MNKLINVSMKFQSINHPTNYPIIQSHKIHNNINQSNIYNYKSINQYKKYHYTKTGH